MKQIIATENAPKAVGPYSQAVEVNGTLYISGQIPVVPADGSVPESIEAQTRQSLKNIRKTGQSLLSGSGTSDGSESRDRGSRCQISDC